MIRNLTRILSIIFCLFVSVFVLDMFGKDFNILALIINLVPTFVAITLTVVAWKWEFCGGILWIATVIIVTLTTKIDWVITLPIIIIGGLNIIAGKLVSK